MNVPKLRFKEFDGEWEENLLKDITEINPKSEALDEKFEYIDLEAVSKGLLINSKVIDKFQAPSRAQRVVSKNDILYQTVRPYQKNNLFINFENKNLQMVASTGYAQIRTDNKIDAKWLYQAINTSKFTHNVLLKCTGTSYPAINSSDLGEIEMKFPELKEQKKIGLLFEIIDKKIQLQQQKIDLLQEQKKGYMQKVFKQELRFKNEEGQYYPDWKNRKIRDLFEVTRGHVLSTKEISEMGKYPVYSSQTKNNGLLGYYDEFLFENAITWTTDGANAGNVKYRSGKFYCTNVCGVLLNKEGYANKCIAEIINSIAFRYVSYVGNPKLMNNVMGDISIDFPCIEEQKKISDFLLILDNKINLEETTLKLLRNQKKGFMQKMFI